MYRFQTCDNEIVEVDPYVMRRSSTVQDLITNNGGIVPDVIPLENIDSATLTVIIHYCDHYKDRTDQEERVYLARETPCPDFDNQFFPRHSDLYNNLITAAGFLGLIALREGCCKYIARELEQKSIEEVAQFFRFEMNPEE